ncbi:hypothetical protein KFK09_005739 [Dendrobium nobile]|uniref:Uncharacterized protein n=1 Tax=Dendrobium nobile TaxID=94219 RepID=A0A8T3BWK3_DENNO|nr:hypothetical protein KFK09_005739 [Dendrobium nobile]
MVNISCEAPAQSILLLINYSSLIGILPKTIEHVSGLNWSRKLLSISLIVNK